MYHYLTPTFYACNRIGVVSCPFISDFYLPQDWPQGEVFPLWQVQSLFSTRSRGKPQGDFKTGIKHLHCVYLSDAQTFLPQCLILPILFYVSVCWKCVKAELPSVYGGKRTSSGNTNKMIFFLWRFHLSLFVYAGYSHIQNWSPCSSVWPSFTQVWLNTLIVDWS